MNSSSNIAAQESSAKDAPINKKVLIAGSLGNGLEWYDYALYGQMAVVFSELFFAKDAENPLILTLLIFAAGFVSRPVGAVFFGWLGDKFGRKTALTTSLFMMAVPTGCIGLLPTYESVGVLSAYLLLVLRLLQGISLGGAYSGSISYVVEHSPPHWRARAGSFIKLSLVIGFLIGSLVSTIVASVMSEADFQSWGWRLPFFVGLGIGFVGLYIKKHGDESPVYEEAKSGGTLSSSPVRDACLKYPLNMFRAFAAYMFVTVPFYTVSIYMISYNKKHLGFTSGEALQINSLAMICMALLVYPAAIMGDRIGRRPVLLAAIASMMLLAYPLVHLMQGGSFMQVALAQCVMALIVGWYMSTMPAMLVEVFPTSIRYTGMSLSYNFCAIVGGFTPAMSEALIQRTGDPTSVMWLLFAAGAFSFIVLYFYKDPWKEPLR